MATNMKVGLTVVGTLGMYTFVANSIPQLESDVPEELSFSADVTADELVTAGRQLFEGAGGCKACHGLGVRAPYLLADDSGEGLIGARCAGRVPGEDCKTYLYQSLVEPNAFLVGEYGPIMPDMGRTLSQTQLWALVAFLQSAGGEVTVTAADLPADPGAAPVAAAATLGTATSSTEPLEIIRGNQCLLCHLLDGEGVQLGPPFDGVGARLSAEAIRNSILNPGAGASEGYETLLGAMPPTFGQTLSAGQLEALVTFLSQRR